MELALIPGDDSYSCVARCIPARVIWVLERITANLHLLSEAMQHTDLIIYFWVWATPWLLRHSINPCHLYKVYLVDTVIATGWKNLLSIRGLERCWPGGILIFSSTFSINLPLTLKTRYTPVNVVTILMSAIISWKTSKWITILPFHFAELTAPSYMLRISKKNCID